MTQTISKTNIGVLCGYVDAGFTLFPCVGLSKIPARKGFLDSGFDPEFSPEPNKNYGVLLKHRYLVLDCDPRSYRPSESSYKKLMADLELPEDLHKTTFTVKTPRGGFHIYFQKPPEFEIVGKLKDYPGLEFKDRWIQAAGSFIERIDEKVINAPYKVVCGHQLQIKPAPAILLARIKYERKVIALTTEITPDSPSDIHRFVQFCKVAEPAVEGHGGDQQTYAVACAGREFGLSEGTIFEIMRDYYNVRCNPAWDEDALKTKIQNAFQYSDRPAGVRSTQNDFVEPLPPSVSVEKVSVRYAFDKNGQMRPLLANLVQLMKYPTVNTEDSVKRTLKIPPIGASLRFDQFAHRIRWVHPAPWFKGHPDWDDDDAIQFKNVISDQLHLDFSTNIVHEAALICAKEKAYHPVRDYLQSLKWDGTPRLDTWMPRYCGAFDNDYVRFVGRKVLIAAVARVFRPGCKFDHVLVLEGEQGQGKSWMWERLTAPWFTDAPLSIQDKGAVEVMQGKWVIELAEMEAHSKYESQTIKGFLTRTEDRCRMAYERSAKSYPRQCIFVGSINPEQSGWLKDRTGNRRYWPVPVTHIRIDELAADRDQLWAEALVAFEKGEKIYVEDARMRALMQDMVDARMHEDPWFGLIAEYLNEHSGEYVAEKGDRLIILPVDLYMKCIGGGPAAFDARASARIMAILKTLGFTKDKFWNKAGYFYTKEIVNEL